MENKDNNGIDNEGYFTHPQGHIRDLVILHEGKDSPPEGQFMGLNGFPFQALYNKEMALPRPVVQMLRTCTFTEIMKDKDGVEIVRNIPRFNLTVLKEGINCAELKAVVVPQGSTETVGKKPGWPTKKKDVE